MLDWFGDVAVDLILDDDESTLLDDEPTPKPHPKVSKEERIRSCGTRFGGYHSPQTGRWKKVMFACGYWRECESCRAVRGKKYQARLERAIVEFPLVYVHLDTSTMTALCNLIGKDRFLRFPQPNDMDIAFVVDEGDLGDIPTKPVDMAFLQSTPWLTIVNTPSDKRVSGQLGIAPAPAAGETATVTVMYSKAPEEVRRAAVIHSIDETKDLDPHTTEAIQAGLDKRAELYHNYLIAHGYEVWLIQKKKLPLDPKTSNWKVLGYFEVIVDEPELGVDYIT